MARGAYTGTRAGAVASTPEAVTPEWTRRGLTAFYHFVQVSLLLASIPNVTAFWAAYESHAMPGGGLSIGGLVTIGDLRNALVGIMIDACVYVTSIVALWRLRTPHGRWVLLPHIIVMLVCGLISFIANWETVSLAATTTQYSHFAVNTTWGPIAFGLGNTLIVSCAPLIAILMVFLAPSIVSRPPALTPEQIAEMTAREEAEIERKARLEAKRLNAQVQVVEAQTKKRTAQVVGATQTARAGVHAAIKGASPAARRLASSGASRGATQGATQGASTDPDDDPDPDGSDPDASSYRWNPLDATGDHDEDADGDGSGDLGATLPHLPAVKVGRSSSSGARNAAAGVNPSASMVARKRATKMSKRRERYLEMTPLQRVRTYREVDYNDLQALLKVAERTASRILTSFPYTRDENALGDRMRVASVDRLVQWLRTQDPQYQVYATQLERCLRPARGAAPKQRARNMVDWDDGDIRTRHLAVVGGPSGNLSRAEPNPIIDAASNAG
jgi:hypothetical protein